MGFLSQFTLRIFLILLFLLQITLSIILVPSEYGLTTSEEQFKYFNEF